MDNGQIIFTNEDIDLFAKASHDFNPLHCDYGYARKTPYGEQVVHGVLGIFVLLKKYLLFHSPFENIAVILMCSSYFIGMVMSPPESIFRFTMQIYYRERPL